MVDIKERPITVKVPRELIEHCARILKNANSYTLAMRELAAEELRALLRGDSTSVVQCSDSQHEQSRAGVDDV